MVQTRDQFLAMLVRRSPVSAPCNTPLAATHHPGTRLEPQDRPIFIVGGAHATAIDESLWRDKISDTGLLSTYRPGVFGGAYARLRVLRTEILNLHPSESRGAGRAALSIASVDGCSKRSGLRWSSVAGILPHAGDAMLSSRSRTRDVAPHSRRVEP